jgi:hypothetical protein
MVVLVGATNSAKSYSPSHVAIAELAAELVSKGCRQELLRIIYLYSCVFVLMPACLPHASCLMPHASCLMPHASCLMPACLPVQLNPARNPAHHPPLPSPPVYSQDAGKPTVSVKILALGPRNQQGHYHLPGGRMHTLRKALVSMAPSQVG